MVDAAERLQVLLKQEATIYRTSDYLTRIITEGQMDARLPVSASSDDSASSPESPSKKRKSLDSSTETNAHPVDPPFQGNTDPSASSCINKHWREKICEWAYQGKLRVKLNDGLCVDAG